MPNNDVIRAQELFAAGGAWAESLYEQWLERPDSLADAWKAVFEAISDEDDDAMTHRQVLEDMRVQARHLTLNCGSVPSCDEFSFNVEYPSRAIYLIHAWRARGHLQAQLDPLHLHTPPSSPDLELGYFGLSENDLHAVFPTGDFNGSAPMTLAEILSRLKCTYAKHVGPELMHISDTARQHWLRNILEKSQSTASFDAQARLRIYKDILYAEEFEHFLHKRYVGQKRFSLEGGESLIPMLNVLIQKAGETGVKEVILGMAHRGRLNVLANVMGKSLSEIFADFEGDDVVDTEIGAGDVKYHMGFSSDIDTRSDARVHLSLAFNPSHLEIITPVLLGSVRARQCRRRDTAKRQVLPVLVHGDAAFAGQGVVAESLNLSGLSGFRTGGSIHIVVNNQIGFTTNPFDSRSTLYCTDIAKMVQAPILHVNGDDPDACCMVMELAMEYRNRFRSDIVIDLVCYRRRGHNEADAPEVTQPLMYHRIQQHPTLKTIYRQQLIQDGVMTEAEAEALSSDYQVCLDRLRRQKHHKPPQWNSLQGRWLGYQRYADTEPKTAVDAVTLALLAVRAHAIPEGFHLHKRVGKIYNSRLQMMRGEEAIDWGCAEAMAYATLVNQGGWVRLSGQDSGRSTFFHRHAVVYDELTGKSFVPLKQVENGETSHFIVVDSMLSELAVMGFEYGYSVAEPRAMMIWEAQYGDFANGAQVVIDQFVAAGESKWKRMSGLVLWMPHGYEGQGAEHSSARLERFLQLCAEDNIQVAYPTTPAQLFHLLRRQWLINSRKPLILMGPKSLLRLKASYSQLTDFSEGQFYPVLGEVDATIEPALCSKVLICSGKVYYDLLAGRQDRENSQVAIIRLERLYPFPNDVMLAELSKYEAASQVVWVQEEPENQGAWFQIKHYLKRVLLPQQRLSHVSRQALAAPAVGSHERHAREQQEIVELAFSEGMKVAGEKHGH